MDKKRVETWVWVLVYAGLLTLCVAVFVLRAGAGAGMLGWAMLGAGLAVGAVGAALVVVRARMDEPVAAKKGPRE